MAHGLRRLRFACTRCGNCCRRFRVPLTGADLARLAEETKREPSTLVEWLSPAHVDMTGEPETFVVLPQGRRLMTLGWQGGGCGLLDGDSCGVHPARPLSCRLYPFDVALGKRGGIRHLRLLDTTDCPHEWGVPVPERSVAELHTMHRDELVRFARSVSEFNQRQRHRARLEKRLLTAGDFLSFVLQRSGHPLPLPGGSPLGEATP